MKSVEDRLRVIICEHLNVRADQVADGSDLAADLGADSLDRVEIIMSVEEEFKAAVGPFIPEKDADGFRTFGDVVRYVERRSAQAD